MRPAEEIGPDLGAFRLVTVGRALHWMNRDVVIDRAYDVSSKAVASPAWATQVKQTAVTRGGWPRTW